MKHLQLRTRLGLSVAAVILVAALITFLIFRSLERRSAFQEAAQHEAALAVIAERNAARILDQAAVADERLNEFASRMSEHEVIAWVEIFDQTGEVIAHSDKARVGRGPLSAHAATVREVLDKGVTIQGPHGPEGFAAFVPLRCPMSEEVNGVVEVAIADPSPSASDRALAQVIASGAAEVVALLISERDSANEQLAMICADHAQAVLMKRVRIFDRVGGVIAESSEQPSGMSDGSRTMVADVIRAGHASGNTNAPNGERLYYMPVFTSIAGPQVPDDRRVTAVIELAMDRSAIEERAAMTTSRYLLGDLLVILVAVLGLALALDRAVIVPVRAVADAATHVADGNLIARVPARRHDEIGQLAVAFNRMATSLADTLVSKERLEQSEARLRTILQDMPVMVDAFDEDMRITLWNGECERVTGYSAEEMIGNPDGFDILYPNQAAQDAVVKGWQACPGAFRDWELELTCKDGSTRTVAWSSMASQVPIEGWAEWSIGVDVTARLEAERRTRESEAVFRKHFEHNPVAIYMWRREPDGEWYLRDWNPAAVEITAGGVTQLDGVKLSDAYADMPQVLADFESVAASGTSIHREMTYQYRTAPIERELDVSYVGVRHDTVMVHTDDVTEKRNAERAIQREERRLRSTLDSQAVFVGLLEPDGTISFVNRASLEAEGLSEEEVLGVRFWETPWFSDSPEEARLVQQAVLQAAAGQSQRLDLNSRSAQGRFYEVDTVFSPLFDEAGAVRQVIVNGLEITERKQAERALAKREAQLSKAQRMASLGFWEWDLESGGLFWSDELYRIYGVDPECHAPNYERFLEAVHPGDRQVVQDRVEEALRGGTAYSLDHRIVWPDGTEHVIHGEAEVTFDDNGNPRKMAGVDMDITEQKAFEQKIERERQRLRDILDSQSAFVAITETDGRVVFLNQAPLQAAGLTLDELRGKLFWETQPFLHSQAVVDLVRRAVEGAAAGQTTRVDVTVQIADGRMMECDTTFAPLLGPSGEVKQVIANALDVTDRKQAELDLAHRESQLRSAQRIASLGFWDWDISAGTLFWSDEIFRIFDIDADRFGASYEAFLEIVHPDDRQVVKDGVDQALRGESTYSIDHRIILRDGTERVVHEEAEVTFDDSSRPMRMAGIVMDITDRVANERRAQESEQRLRAIAEAAPDYIVGIDCNGIVTYVNRPAPGVERRDLIGSGFLDWIVDADRHVAAAALARLIETDETQQYEVRGAGEGGEQRWYSTRISAMFEDGRVSGAILCARDITETREAQEAVERREAIFNAFFDAAPIGMCMYDQNLRYVTINQQLADINGVPRDSHSGRTIGEIIPDLADVVFAQAERAAAGDPVLNVEVAGELPSAPGKHRNWLVSYFRIPLPHDGAMGVGVTVLEVTDHLEALHALRQSNLRYRTLVETLPYGVQEADQEGVITFSNRAHASLKGLEPSEVIGRRYWDWVADSEKRGSLERYNSQIMVDCPEPTPYVGQDRTSDGRIVDIRVDWDYRRDEAGNVNGTIAVVTDITEQLRTHRRIQEQDERLAASSRLSLMGEFAASIAHELHQPLTSVVNYAYVAKQLFDSDANPDEVVKHLAVIREQATRAGEIVHRLGTMLRGDAGDLTQHDLNQVVRDVIDLVRESAQRDNINVSLDLSRHIDKPEVDAIQIQQLLTNLFRNSRDALRALPKDHVRRIEIRTCPTPDGGVRLEVRDNGPGIPDDLKAKIFEPFFSASNDGSHMGMGLAICQTIARHHDAVLRCVEPEDGTGAIFQVDFPTQ